MHPAMASSCIGEQMPPGFDSAPAPGSSSGETTCLPVGAKVAFCKASEAELTDSGDAQPALHLRCRLLFNTCSSKPEGTRWAQCHGCCWETFYIFAYCGLVGNPHLTAKNYFFCSPFNVNQGVAPSQRAQGHFGGWSA